MFDLDPENRITFSDIRYHALFKKYFPVVNQASKILYSKKFQPSKIIKRMADPKKKPNQNGTIAE